MVDLIKFKKKIHQYFSLIMPSKSFENKFLGHQHWISCFESGFLVGCEHKRTSNLVVHNLNLSPLSHQLFLGNANVEYKLRNWIFACLYDLLHANSSNNAHFYFGLQKSTCSPLIEGSSHGWAQLFPSPYTKKKNCD